MPDFPTDLGRTLESFNRLSAELNAGYRRLEERAVRLEKQLNSSRREKVRLAARLSALADSLPGGVLVLDEEGFVSQANATAETWFGARTAGQAWCDLLSRCQNDPPSDALELTMPDGRSVSVCRSETSNRGETIVLLTDVTLDRKLQSELHRNRRLAAMGEMAARVAHQVRTPLSVALLYAGQLESVTPSSGDFRHPVEKIAGQLRKLDRMTEDMLAFVRTPEPASAEFTVGALVDEVADLVEGFRPETARFTCSMDTALRDSVAVRGNSHALAGGLCNLVENAWLAGADGTEIRVTVEGPGGQFVVFRITDNGPGIPAEVQKRIFEPFVSSRGNGTGLGLAVARSAFELHGGRLFLDESGRDGTVFLARLPVVHDDRRDRRRRRREVSA